MYCTAKFANLFWIAKELKKFLNTLGGLNRYDWPPNMPELLQNTKKSVVCQSPALKINYAETSEVSKMEK